MSATIAHTDGLNSSANIISPINMFYFLLTPALLLWFFYWRLSRRHMLELAERIPGPKGLPLIGNALDLVGSSHSVFRTIIEKGKEYNEVIKIWIGPKLIVFLVDPRDIELLLSSHVYIDKSPEYRFFKPWLGNGLLISTGHKWRQHRKLIAPTFHLNVLKSFIDLFNENSRLVVKKMQKENGKVFDCHDYMSECTVEILLETAMGVSKKTQDQSGYDYAMAVMKMCDILHLRHRKMWLYPDLFFNLTQYAKKQVKLLNTIHSLTKKVIRNKKAAFDTGTRGSLATTSINTVNIEKSKSDSTKTNTVEGLSFGQSSNLKDDLDVEENDVGEKKRLAFLDLLLESAENGALISDEEIKNQVDTIMFEGHDTTAAGSSFFLSMMGVHQQIQDKVIQELDEIFGESDRPATFQDTLEMKYLERCLMETLRMYPPVPIIARSLKQDLKLASSDIVVPAGATITVATFKLHRLESIYPNPDVFNPDNFLPEKQANRHYYAFVPFSAGPRSCVGRKYAMLKLKIILSTILRNFRVYSDLKEEEFKLQADIILKREEGFQIRLEPRQRKSKTL
ncbi:cytochrome P450 4g15 [Anopheles arabiensis]|uniref:AGAP001076-PA n=3 Tax=gambiae species complex TaxID=44542 RepID=F5HL83_ANOGA|nr:cytochrome P450 4g15 [Anopheles arabiensis]XP_040172810.1 cytochrome P450 4g15 [Anopheles arabiensis]XP_040225197.1 cytochrome P450 4g15 [Anopheles coluzzii]EAL40625.3 AGAP001076-PA [Anopheles gambiae str. PEST]EGK97044.1 AGAP001076-PB [Anopheles gambiae str. PEST]EGK97045.1 AGAP001076-PC [Anopheles gambiae str. PEST]